jgi:cytochrome c oxidase assembly protein subunit 23
MKHSKNEISIWVDHMCYVMTVSCPLTAAQQIQTLAINSSLTSTCYSTSPNMSIERSKEKVDYTKDGQYRFYPDNPTSDDNKEVFRTKMPSQYYDPCHESAQMSLNCLERNNYEKDQCIKYFQAYRDCKKEWVRQRKKDRKNGNPW